MRKKSEKDKKVEGTKRRDRSKKATVVSISKIPTPPTYLSVRGKKIFKEIFNHVKNNGALSIDTFMVASASFCLSEIEKYRKYLMQEPYRAIQKYKTGAKNISAELVALQRYEAQFFKYSEYLGLDIRSREKLMSFEVKEDEGADPIMRLLNGTK